MAVSAAITPARPGEYTLAAPAAALAAVAAFGRAGVELRSGVAAVGVEALVAARSPLVLVVIVALLWGLGACAARMSTPDR